MLWATILEIKGCQQLHCMSWSYVPLQFNLVKIKKLKLKNKIRNGTILAKPCEHLFVSSIQNADRNYFNLRACSLSFRSGIVD